VSGLLLPGERRVTPFDAASHLLDEPSALHSIAADHGYLHLKGLIPDCLLSPVRAFTREVFAEFGWVRRDPENLPAMEAIPDAKLSGRGWDDRDWVEFQQRFSEHRDFLALANSPTVMAVVETIMGEPAWLASVNFCWIKLPGSPEHTTLPHQDEWYLPQCQRMWTVWVPLVDTPFELGPLAVVPGSNKGGVEDHHTAFTGIQVAPDIQWASSEVLAGDVVFFSARTIHCAWSNVSSKLARVSADIRYEPRSVGRESRLRKSQEQSGFSF
jgi:ectoine hydroxylase-related dioxygenase (phytanoyl-CoA dioxygenase family)